MNDQIKLMKSELSRRTVMQGIASMSLGVSSGFPLMAASESSSTSSRKVVRIFCPGGFSHLDSFDPKPESPDIMGATKTIKTDTGETISEHFPEMAKRMKHLALVRSMVSSEGDHERGMYLIGSSYNMIGTIQHPSFGAWMQKLRGTLNEALPSSVAIGGAGSGFKGGYLGTNYAPFSIRNPNAALSGLMMKEPTSDESKKLLKLMAEIRTDFHKKYRFSNLDAYRKYYNDSIRFMQSKDLEAFDLTKEDEATQKMYDIPYGPNFLLARRLIEANVQYVSVMIGGWDHHGNLFDSEVFPMQARNLDKAKAVFIDDLNRRGLLKDTVITFNTEFGRTPRINDAKGRDHHRMAYSGWFAGAGVKGGTIYGKTNSKGSKVLEDSVSPSDFNGTLASLMGLNTEEEIFSPDNRPFTVARGGKIIKEVLS